MTYILKIMFMTEVLAELPQVVYTWLYAKSNQDKIDVIQDAGSIVIVKFTAP